jgi:DeoR/GlpR family transcriptional regulator of sugar metabolism
VSVSTSSREQRLAQLLDTIRTHGVRWTSGRVQNLRRLTGGPVQRGTARRDLEELARRGHLNQHGPEDGRFYTLRTRKDRAV